MALSALVYALAHQIVLCAEDAADADAGVDVAARHLRETVEWLVKRDA
jgi:hypothetical protein